MLSEPTRLEILLRRDRTVVVAGLAALTVVAWVYLVSMTSRMSVADGMAMPPMQSWRAVEIVLLFVMWGVMMVAMMVPTVTPLLLMFARADRQRVGNRAVTRTGTLLLGYLLVWMGFSVLATLAQWGLHSAALLSPTMVGTSSIFGGLLLIAAGVFQFTPMKRACLTQCRSPLSFLMSYWREERWGSFILGLQHGTYCVGCCWLLMALLFVAGVTNLFWMVGISVFVLAEKAAPNGDLIRRIAGGTLIATGIALILG